MLKAKKKKKRKKKRKVKRDFEELTNVFIFLKIVNFDVDDNSKADDIYSDPTMTKGCGHYQDVQAVYIMCDC